MLCDPAWLWFDQWWAGTTECEIGMILAPSEWKTALQGPCFPSLGTLERQLRGQVWCQHTWLWVRWHDVWVHLMRGVIEWVLCAALITEVMRGVVESVLCAALILEVMRGMVEWVFFFICVQLWFWRRSPLTAMTKRRRTSFWRRPRSSICSHWSWPRRPLGRTTCRPPNTMATWAASTSPCTAFGSVSTAVISLWTREQLFTKQTALYCTEMSALVYALYNLKTAR